MSSHHLLFPLTLVSGHVKESLSTEISMLVSCHLGRILKRLHQSLKFIAGFKAKRKENMSWSRLSRHRPSSKALFIVYYKTNKFPNEWDTKSAFTSSHSITPPGWLARMVSQPHTTEDPHAPHLSFLHQVIRAVFRVLLHLWDCSSSVKTGSQVSKR